jgi:S1-C subfamily serine protease
LIKKTLSKQIIILVISIIFLIFNQNCSSTYQRNQKKADDTIKNNQVKYLQLKYEMTKAEVIKIMNNDLSLSARKENPKYSTLLRGLDSSDYFVRFYECADLGYRGNINFDDKRFLPIVFSEDKLVGINWNDYKKIIGETFENSESQKTKSRATNTGRDKESESFSSGTGFLVNVEGYCVTNYHVVNDAKRIEVYSPKFDKKFMAKVFSKDISNDLVILKIDDSTYTKNLFNNIDFNILEQDEIKIGQEVITLGFPLTDYLGSTARLSNGLINSKFGLQEDPRTYQISNPLQPGNSGGPLFNLKGELVGIVVPSLNAAYFLYNTGTVPQNVNFAIKSDYLRTLMKSSDIKITYNVTKENNELKVENLVEKIDKYIFMIVCEN